MNKIAAFIYHDVTDNPQDSGFQNKAAFAYKHPTKEFIDNLEIIRNAPSPIITITQLPGIKSDSIMLTFDDGGISSLYIADTLDKYNLKGHFFITTGLIGKPLFLTREHINDLHTRGHIIGSHSHTHPFAFYNQPYGAMVEEWKTSKSVLEDIIGAQVISCSVPGGDADAKTYQSAQESGFTYIFDSEITMYPRSMNDALILGRVCPKQGTSLEVVKDYAHFKGFGKARNIRALKKLVKKIVYPVYTLVRKRPE